MPVVNYTYANGTKSEINAIGVFERYLDENHTEISQRLHEQLIEIHADIDEEVNEKIEQLHSRIDELEEQVRELNQQLEYAE